MYLSIYLFIYLCIYVFLYLFIYLISLVSNSFDREAIRVERRDKHVTRRAPSVACTRRARRARRLSNPNLPSAVSRSMRRTVTRLPTAPARGTVNTDAQSILPEGAVPSLRLIAPHLFIHLCIYLGSHVCIYLIIYLYIYL